MNRTLYQNVISNLKWNAIESFFYSSLMIAHQAALFATLDIATYGLVGSIFSYIFFSELTLCLGLNSCAGTFLGIWSHSKKGFRLFFGWNMAINYCVAFIYFAVGYYTVGFITNSLYILVASIIIFEKNKQICKTVMHILFKSRLKSFIELSSFITFLVLVWGQYLYGYPLTIVRLIIPFFITSLVSCIAYMFATITWYKRLPEDDIVIDRETTIRIVKNRLLSVTHKTSKRFFSANFLIPMVAARFGMGQAGILKITTQVAYYTTLVLRKAFGNASNALFAHTKDKDHTKNSDNIQWITTLLGYATATLIGCAATVIAILHWYIPEIFTSHVTILTIASFCNAIIMNSIITFEQWFIIHEKALFLTTAQIIVTGCWLFILLFAHAFSPIQLLIISTTCIMILFVYLAIIIMMHQKNRWFLGKNKGAAKFKT